MGIKLQNVDKVFERLDNIADGTNIEVALGQACALVEASAKRRAPKGTGELRRSITSKVEGTTGTVFTPLHYAPYVEFGTGLFAENGGRKDVPWVYCDDEGHWHTTSGMYPQPYMRPALDENRAKIIELIREGIIKND